MRAALEALPVFEATFTAAASEWKVTLGTKYVRVVHNFQDRRHHGGQLRHRGRLNQRWPRLRQIGLAEQRILFPAAEGRAR